MQNPFDWSYQTTQPASSDVFDAFTIFYLVLFLAGFVVSAYLYYRPWTKPLGTMFRRRSVIKATGIAMWVFGIGLFFFLIRLLQIDPLTFGQPIWMWLSFLAVILMVVWIALSWRRERRAAVAAAEATNRARRGAPVTQGSTRPVKRTNTLH